MSKTISLNLEGIDKEDRDIVKQEVGEYIIDQIVSKIAKGKTPVEGQKDFDKLTKGYAKSQKGGNRLANLELFGDMLDNLTFDILSGNRIEIGILDPDEAPKAYAHNTGFAGHPHIGKKNKEGGSTVRRFIPRNKQKFSSDIMDGVRSIINEFRNG